MIWFVLACGPKNPEQPSPSVQTGVDTVEAMVQPVVEDTPSDTPTVMLDGISISVEWDDGDTFHGKKSDGSKIKARLAGYNTLESYGPVHQWGEWTAKELYVFAKESGVFASKTVWNCTDTKQGGGYGRILVDCPELRKAMLEEGYAHPFSIGGPAPEADLQAMRAGMENKAGIWGKGVPSVLITSLHSQDEKPDKEVYNRVCDLQTGECAERIHADTYETCETVCVENGCMIYVPYKQRYGDGRAECLR